MPVQQLGAVSAPAHSAYPALRVFLIFAELQRVT
jgi:hypothetical protein